MISRIIMLAFLAVSIVGLSSADEDSEWIAEKILSSINLNKTNTTSNPESILTSISETLDTTTNSSVASVTVTSPVEFKSIYSVESPQTPNEFNKNFNFHKIFDTIDKQNLIMALAFLIGLILLSCLIAISICVYNSLSKCSTGSKKSPWPSEDLATNPAYGSVKYDPNFDSGTGKNLSKIDIMIHPGSDIPLLPPKSNNFNSTSSLSCSTASINSVIYNKTPGTVEILKNNIGDTTKKSETVPSQPSTPIKANIRTSISNIVNTFSSTPAKPSKNDEKSSSDNERSYLLDEMDGQELQPNETSTSNRKPIFQSQPKTGQQMLREQKISKHPSYLRTHSESVCNSNQTDSNRLSAASSRSSILMQNFDPLNFDQIKDDIDDLAINKEKLISRTSLNKLKIKENGKDGDQSDSTNTSIADIYIQELINKHHQSTQKNNGGVKKLIKQDTNASVSSIISENTRERLKLKRLSMNVDISKVNFEMNPGGAQSVSNLDKNTSVSNYTLGSEKSCY